MQCVGIDIGTYSIKLAEVILRNKTYVLKRFEEIPLGTNSGYDVNLEIIEKVRALVANYPKDTKFIGSISQDLITTRFKSFPFIDRLKISKLLPFELEEDIPFPVEDALFEVHPVRFVGKFTELLAFAAPRAVIAATRSKYQEAGVDLGILSSEAAAVANCFENWEEQAPVLTEKVEASPLHMMINIGHSKTILLYFQDRRLVTTRTISWGGKQMADAIMRRYEVPYSQALTELQSKAFLLPQKSGASYDQVVFSDTIQKSLGDLIREVRLSILETKSDKGVELDAIWLTGGGAQVLHLPAILTQYFDAPVNLYKPDNKFGLAYLDLNPHQWMTCPQAIGLALEGFKKPRNPAINFLKEEFAKDSHMFGDFWITWGQSIKYASLAFALFFVYTYLKEMWSYELLEKMDTQFVETAQQTTGIKPNAITPESVEKWISKQKRTNSDKKVLAALTEIESGLDILKKFSDLVPARKDGFLEFKRFELTEKQLVVEGYTDSNQMAVAIQNAMGKMGTNVQSFGSNLLPARGKVTFLYRAQLARSANKKVTQ